MKMSFMHKFMKEHVKTLFLQKLMLFIKLFNISIFDEKHCELSFDKR